MKIVDELLEENDVPGLTTTELYPMILKKAREKNDKAIPRSISPMKLARLMKKEYNIVDKIKSPHTGNLVNVWGY